MVPDMTPQLLSQTVRRVTFSAMALTILGQIGLYSGLVDPIYTVFVTGIGLGCVIALYFIQAALSEGHRQMGIAAMEQYIAHGHAHLSNDDIPEEEKAGLEASVAAAQATLMLMDRALPPHKLLLRKLRRRGVPQP
jgi:hypothetical protein